MSRPVGRMLSCPPSDALGDDVRGTKRLWPYLAATTILLAMARPAEPPADPHAGHIQPAPHLVPAAVATPAPLPRTEWTVTADDAQASAPAVLDGDPRTAWRTAPTALPHVLTIDT